MLLSDKYPFLTEYFTRALSTNVRALPQSILFYGNDADAQFTFATEIARLLNCTSDKSDNCECLNCRWIRENSHPAVLTISRIDNKPDDDDSKTVISIKQSQMIKEALVSASEFHRVFIFCDRDENGNIALKSDLRNLYGGSSGGTKTVLPVYATSGDNSITAIADKYDAQITALQAVEFQARQTYQQAEKAYEGLRRPTYI